MVATAQRANHARRIGRSATDSSLDTRETTLCPLGDGRYPAGPEAGSCLYQSLQGWSYPPLREVRVQERPPSFRLLVWTCRKFSPKALTMYLMDFGTNGLLHCPSFHRWRIPCFWTKQRRSLNLYESWRENSTVVRNSLRTMVLGP